jgi:hypothetical protein
VFESIFDSSGAWIKAFRMGGRFNDFAKGIAVDSNDNSVNRYALSEIIESSSHSKCLNPRTRGVKNTLKHKVFE